jgi:oligopeptide transport system substrate-binding protein
MRKTKWLLFVYLALIVLLIGGMGLSLRFTAPRDPHMLYLQYFGTIRTLDPAEVNDTVGAAFCGQIYECLYNYRFGVQPYELFPELAASMPEYSADKMVLTIHLRKGIHFYDPDKKVFADGIGPEITSRDFIYSFKRLCDFNLGSANYSVVFEGNIVGLDDWWNYTKKTQPQKIDWDRPVTGFEAPDDWTIRLRLTHPYPQLIYNLAQVPTAVVSHDAVRYWGPAFRRHPLGTGPYYLKELLSEQRVMLQANPTYRGRPDIDGNTPLADSEKLPTIKQVELDYFAEQVPAWLLFTQGLYDAAGIPKESFNQAISAQTGRLTPQMEKKGILLTKTPDAATEYIGINMMDPILGENKPLRQAMSMALDRKTFIHNFTNDRGEPAIGPIPPGFPTFDPEQVNPYTQFNLDAARQKMGEAIKINGGPIPPLSLLMRDADTESRQMAEYYTSQMQRIGVTLVPEYRDFARWEEMTDNRQTQLFDSGWEADYPDELNFLQLFYGENAPAGGVNSTAYVNPKFDELYRRARVMPDSPERRKLYRQMEDIVMEDCTWLSVMYPIAFVLHYDWVKGTSPMDYGYGYRQFITLDETLRSKQLLGNH